MSVARRSRMALGRAAELELFERHAKESAVTSGFNQGGGVDGLPPFPIIATSSTAGGEILEHWRNQADGFWCDGLCRECDGFCK